MSPTATDLMRAADPARSPVPPDEGLLARITAAPLDAPVPSPPTRRRSGVLTPAIMVALTAAAALALTGPWNDAAPDLAAEAAAAAAVPDREVQYLRLRIETVVSGSGARSPGTRVQTVERWARGDEARIRWDDGSDVVLGRDGVARSSGRGEGARRPLRGNTAILVRALRVDLLSTFRERHVSGALQDGGPERFAGRPARVYVDEPSDVDGVDSGRASYYVDTETRRPLGSVTENRGNRAQIRVTTVVERLERLAPTPDAVAALRG